MKQFLRIFGFCLALTAVLSFAAGVGCERKDSATKDTQAFVDELLGEDLVHSTQPISFDFSK